MSAKLVKSDHIEEPDMSEVDAWFYGWFTSASQSMDFDKETSIQCARMGFRQGYYSGFHNTKLQYNTKKLI